MTEYINKESITNPTTDTAKDISKDISTQQPSPDHIGQAADADHDTDLDSATSGMIRKSPVWWDFVIIVLLFAVSQGVGAFVCSLLGIMPSQDGAMYSSDAEVADGAAYIQGRYVAFSYLFAMIVCLPLLWGYWHARGLNMKFSFRAPGWASPFRLLCGYVLLWCISITVEPLAELFAGNQDMLGGGGWLLVSALLLAPIFEETVFRGYIAGGMRRAYGGLTAWICSSLIFGIIHITPSVIVSASFCGLVLGFYYLRYRSIVLVMMLHAMNNATACFLNAIGMSNTTMREALGEGTVYYVVYCISAIITIIALIRMFRLVRRIKNNDYDSLG